MISRALVIVLPLLCGLFAQAAPPVPLIHAHAHNDYLHLRPLLDALDHGFCSVEADVFLVNGELLVAHKRTEVKPGQTLQKLYLEPLRARVEQNGGRVFPGGPEFTLLIDLKSAWTNTYPALRTVLANYADVLSAFRGNAKRTNAITVILTGDRAPEMFAGEVIRFAAYDGTSDDLASTLPANLIPWISGDWKKQFTWNGHGAIPPGEKSRLTQLVATAHEHGRRVRFWGAPDSAACWAALLAAGVDLINTDDLAGLEKHLNGKTVSPGTSSGTPSRSRAK